MAYIRLIHAIDQLPAALQTLDLAQEYTYDNTAANEALEPLEQYLDKMVK